jgi:hypothetical protein
VARVGGGTAGGQQLDDVRTINSCWS